MNLTGEESLRALNTSRQEARSRQASSGARMVELAWHMLKLVSW